MTEFNENEMLIIERLVNFTTKHTDDVLDSFIENSKLSYDEQQEFRKKIDFYWDEE